MPTLNPIDYKNIQQGLITEGSVAESQFPLNAVSESVNFHFDKIGSAIVRPGTTALGQQLTGNCLGLYEFRNSTETKGVTLIGYLHPTDRTFLKEWFRSQISKAEQRVIDSIWSEITDKGNMIRDDENGDYYEVKITKEFMRSLEGDEPK